MVAFCIQRFGQETKCSSGGGDLDSPGVIVTNTGGRYDPVTDSWTSMTVIGAPSARNIHSAVWTGEEMLIWGGSANCCGPDAALPAGGKYDPVMNTWAPMSSVGAPLGHFKHSFLWTGSEMIIWGGRGIDPLGPWIYSNEGGRYSPTSDTWTSMQTVDAPSARFDARFVWTGGEMIVWGGFDGSRLNTGSRYNPTMNSWIPTTQVDAPSARNAHVAVWTGSEMIIWGGFDGGPLSLNSGGRYGPGTLVVQNVDVDIKPGADPNKIKLVEKGKIAVALLSTPEFDATTVDPLSVLFGSGEATETHGKGHITDVDEDGDLDLMLHFSISESGIQCGDTTVSLTGQTFGGQAIEGSDLVTTVGC